MSSSFPTDSGSLQPRRGTSPYRRAVRWLWVSRQRQSYRSRIDPRRTGARQQKSRDQCEGKEDEQAHQGIEGGRKSDLLVGRPDIGLHSVVAALDDRGADRFVEGKNQRERRGAEDTGADERQLDVE